MATFGKMRKILSFVTISILFGCSEVHFDESMPIAASNIKSFNNNLIGSYLYNDSVLKLKDEQYYNSQYFRDLYQTKDSLALISLNLIITKKCLYHEGDVKFYYDINKVDTSKVGLRHKKKKKIYDNGFLIFETPFSDTVVDLSRKDKLKAYKGKFYLNHFVEEHDWEIYQLKVSKDSLLSIGVINNNDAEKLKEYLIVKNQVLGNIVHLSDTEFYNFVEKGGFREKYRFKKSPSTDNKLVKDK